MIAGSVSSFTVDARGNVLYTGTVNSLALALSTDRAAANLVASGFPATDPLPLPGSRDPPFSSQAPASVALIATMLTQLTAIYKMVMTLANSDAGTIVTYLQTFATAHVTNQQLGVMPASTAAGTPIDP